MDADEDKIGEEAGVGNVKGVNFLQYPEWHNGLGHSGLRFCKQLWEMRNGNERREENEIIITLGR
jgi:hypothetical protein